MRKKGRREPLIPAEEEGQMEIWQFVVLSLAAIGAVILLAEPETLEEQAERLTREAERGRKV